MIQKSGFSKRVAIVLATMAMLLLASSASASTVVLENKPRIPFSGCYVYGKLLAGKVQVVTTGLGRATDRVPTYKVKVVTSFPNLKVKAVSSFPRKCGEWQLVDSFPDFKIRYVDSFPDFTIKVVSSFPGL